MVGSSNHHCCNFAAASAKELLFKNQLKSDAVTQVCMTKLGCFLLTGRQHSPVLAIVGISVRLSIRLSDICAGTE